MKYLALVLVLLAGRFAVADGGNDESDPFLGQLNSIEFLPLEVGNSWTYTHVYRNGTYFEDAPGVFPDIDPADLKQFEVPGYPFGQKISVPPESLLLPDGRELVIEITHTETIEGFEYFVFSEPDYEWPPLPDGFLSGQKVRVTEDRILVFWRRGQDQPLYEFGTGWLETGPDSPEKEIWWEGNLRTGIETVGFNFGYQPGNWEISFTSGYGAGLGIYYLLHPGTELSMFENSLVPVSATISGNEILYEELAFSRPQTSVSPKSWGSLKQGLKFSP